MKLAIAQLKSAVKENIEQVSDEELQESWNREGDRKREWNIGSNRGGVTGGKVVGGKFMEIAIMSNTRLHSNSEACYLCARCTRPSMRNYELKPTIEIFVHRSANGKR